MTIKVEIGDQIPLAKFKFIPITSENESLLIYFINSIVLLFILNFVVYIELLVVCLKLSILRRNGRERRL